MNSWISLEHVATICLEIGDKAAPSHLAACTRTSQDGCDNEVQLSAAARAGNFVFFFATAALFTPHGLQY